MLICLTCRHVDTLILGHSLTKPQNQPNRAFQQKNLFKIYIIELKAALNENVFHVEIAKPYSDPLEMSTDTWLDRTSSILLEWKKHMTFLWISRN